MHCGSCPSYDALARDAVRYEEERDRARAELERVSEDRDSWEQRAIMAEEINGFLQGAIVDALVDLAPGIAPHSLLDAAMKNLRQGLSKEAK